MDQQLGTDQDRERDQEANVRLDVMEKRDVDAALDVSRARLGPR
jgi:hypothetical protein